MVLLNMLLGKLCFLAWRNYVSAVSEGRSLWGKA